MKKNNITPNFAKMFAISLPLTALCGVLQVYSENRVENIVYRLVIALFAGCIALVLPVYGVLKGFHRNNKFLTMNTLLILIIVGWVIWSIFLISFANELNGIVIGEDCVASAQYPCSLLKQ